VDQESSSAGDLPSPRFYLQQRMVHAKFNVEVSWPNVRGGSASGFEANDALSGVDSGEVVYCLGLVVMLTSEL
jgi:hypothetical protein